jgi:uncharacterized membrane protein YeaQ/YmgE (transglycosylase-associated protein family)
MNRDTRSFVTLGLIGLIAGFLASVVAGGRGGLIGYLVSGVIGAFVGTWVLRALGVNLGIRNAFASQVATATIGAIIVIVIARLIA